jgi:hypothetical protein
MKKWKLTPEQRENRERFLAAMIDARSERSRSSALCVFCDLFHAWNMRSEQDCRLLGLTKAQQVYWKYRSWDYARGSETNTKIAKRLRKYFRDCDRYNRYYDVEVS